MKRKLWTKEEDKLLIMNYATAQKEELLYLFPGRWEKWNSLRSRAQTLGLNRLMSSLKEPHTPLIDGNVSDFEKGFLVALIEGEGTITCSTPQIRKGARVHPAPYIRIPNTSKELLKYANNIIGGRITRHIKAKTYKNTKDLFLLAVCGVKKVLRTLELLSPHFICKKKICDAVIKLCKERLTQPRYTPFSEKEIELYKEIRYINKR